MKVPEPKKLPSGNWFIRLRLGGEEICITKPTKAECKQEAQTTKADYLAGKRQSVSKQAKDLTLKEACRKYIDKYSSTISPTTLRSYRSYAENRFPAYLDKRLSDIDWQEMINIELKTKSEKTVKNAWGLVHAALKNAQYPVPEVKLAKVPINEIAFLQPEEIKLFCEAVKGRSYEIPALLELHGLRFSEVKGLTWDNVDLKQGLIHVRGATVRGEDGYVDKKTNKNATSTRTVPIMIPQLQTALEAADNKHGKVADIGANTLLEDVKRACRRAGITEVTNHGLRHSFASLGYHLGISERQLMAWGGWADYHTMHKIYIRLASSSEETSKQKMQSFFS